MDRATAREEVKTREPDFLQKAKVIMGKQTYICPHCGNGSGSSGDGISPYFSKGNGAKRYKCFVCDIDEDVIGLWKIHNNISDYKEAFESLYDYYGLIVDNDDWKTVDQKYTKSERTMREQREKKENHMSYFAECAGNIGKTDYFKKRGLSDAVIAEYMLGFDDNYTKGIFGKPWKAAIIPTGKDSYVVRNTDPSADKDNRYRKQGSSEIYLSKTLTQAEAPIFIVEGELDALSIIEAGGTAVALGSTSNSKKLLKMLEEKKPSQKLILALDNDERGKKAEDELAGELRKLNISFYRYDLYGKAKDANEALMENRELFVQAVNNAINAETEAYMKEYAAAFYLEEFVNGIKDSVNTSAIPTGFEKLDKILDGGLYEGLYAVGAISSLGKTTLITQMADQMAEAGKDILIFSLEMARSEIMAKSISRLTLQNVLENGGNVKDAKTSRGITTGKRYVHYSTTEKELIKGAIAKYGSFASNIYIHEGIGDIGVVQIREAIDRHIAITGNSPVVVVDYLQILAPYNDRATDKQNTDKAVLELKRISRDFKTPVIAISSFNRENYKKEVGMEAFKESGAIEYSCDVLLGLQMKGAGKDKFDANEAKRKDPREVELVILKNRNGKTGDVLGFKYYPMFNYFKED